jgi:hypothetical protein
VDGILEGNKTWGGSWVVGCTNSHTHMLKRGVCVSFACLSIPFFQWHGTGVHCKPWFRPHCSQSPGCGLIQLYTQRDGDETVWLLYVRVLGVRICNTPPLKFRKNAAGWWGVMDTGIQESCA